MDIPESLYYLLLACPVKHAKYFNYECNTWVYDEKTDEFTYPEEMT